MQTTRTMIDLRSIAEKPSGPGAQPLRRRVVQNAPPHRSRADVEAQNPEPAILVQAPGHGRIHPTDGSGKCA
jgi:hypothetical protein